GIGQHFLQERALRGEVRASHVFGCAVYLEKEREALALFVVLDDENRIRADGELEGPVTMPDLHAIAEGAVRMERVERETRGAGGEEERDGRAGRRERVRE